MIGEILGAFAGGFAGASVGAFVAFRKRQAPAAAVIGSASGSGSAQITWTPENWHVPASGTAEWIYDEQAQRYRLVDNADAEAEYEIVSETYADTGEPVDENATSVVEVLQPMLDSPGPNLDAYERRRRWNDRIARFQRGDHQVGL